jgi:hypothetical protein
MIGVEAANALCAKDALASNADNPMCKIDFII